jgi:hypothetical protein
MVVIRPRPVFATEDHVTGWEAIAWAYLAAPLKRFIIEFPFVATYACPTPRFIAAGLLMPCIRNIVYRGSCARLTPSLLA